MSLIATLQILLWFIHVCLCVCFNLLIVIVLTERNVVIIHLKVESFVGMIQVHLQMFYW